MGRRNRSLTSAVARAAAFHTTAHLAGGGGSRIIAWPVLVIATLIAYTWTTVAGGWTALVVGAGLMWAWHRTAVVSQTGHGVGLVRSARSAPRTLLYAWAGTTALWLWQTALTPGGGPMGALLLLVLAILLLLGVALTHGLLRHLDLRGALLGLGVVLLARPIAAGIALRVGRRDRGRISGLDARERAVTAFFGVRGIGSIYYLAYATGHAPVEGQRWLWSTVAFTIVLSVVAHGVLVTPAMAWVERHRAASAPV